MSTTPRSPLSNTFWRVFVNRLIPLNFFLVISSRDEPCRPLGRKQRSVRGPKTRCPALGIFGKATSKETSSPEVVPTATGKKLALPKPHFSSMDIAVGPLVTDGASSSDSICEMNGLRLIDLSDLLASG